MTPERDALARLQELADAARQVVATMAYKRGSVTVQEALDDAAAVARAEGLASGFFDAIIRLRPELGREAAAIQEKLVEDLQAIRMTM